MVKYKLSEPEKDCSTRFLERDESTLTCPYYNHPTKEDPKGEASCGDWCPLFSVEEVDKGIIVYLLCGSGNAAYTIEK